MLGTDESKTEQQPGTRPRDKALRLLAGGAVLVALGGAVWSALAGESCAECERAAELLGDFPLAWMGVVFYAALFGAMARKGLCREVMLGTQVAAAIHLVLLAMLVRYQVACPSCILTAAGALLAAGFCLAVRPASFRRAYVTIPTVALIALVSFSALKTHADRQRTRVADEAVAATIDGLGPVGAGRARIVIFTRPRCPPCAELTENVLPKLRKEFKESLVLDEFPAPKGLSTPTVVVLGAQRKHFVGVPPANALRMAFIKARMPPDEGR